MFRLQAAGLGSHFDNRYSRSIVNKNRRSSQLTHGLGQALPVFLRQVATAHLVTVDSSFRTQHPGDQLLGRHFQAEDTYDFFLFHGGILGNIQNKAGFSQARASCHNGKFGGYQPGGEIVQLVETRRDA